MEAIDKWSKNKWNMILFENGFHNNEECKEFKILYEFGKFS